MTPEVRKKQKRGLPETLPELVGQGNCNINGSIAMSFMPFISMLCVFDFLLCAALCLFIYCTVAVQVIIADASLSAQLPLSFPHSVSPYVCLPVTPTAETHKPEEDTFGVSD